MHLNVCWSQQYWTGRELLRSCGARHWRALTREPHGDSGCAEYVVCDLNAALACMLCLYTHTPPLSQRPALGFGVCTAWHLWKTAYRNPARFKSRLQLCFCHVLQKESGYGGPSALCMLLDWIPTDPWVQRMPAWCRSGAALIYKIKCWEAKPCLLLFSTVRA